MCKLHVVWKLSRKEPSAGYRRVVPAFPGSCGLDVGDGPLWEVNVEPQKVKVVHGFQFDWITKKVVVDEGLDGWMGEKVFVVHDEAVVDVPVVGEVEGSVLEKVVMELVPRMLNEGDGDVAKGRRELGANPSPTDLLVGVVACPENAGVECKGYNGCNVGGVEGALCRMFLCGVCRRGNDERGCQWLWCQLSRCG